MENNISGKELEDVLAKVLDARAPVDRETHIKHHKYIDALIEKEQKKIERNDALKMAAMRTVVTLSVGGILTFLWHKGGDVFTMLAKLFSNGGH